MMKKEPSSSILRLMFSLVLCWSITAANLQGQANYDLEFSNFSLPDSITSGGTLLLTGTLKNNGDVTIAPQIPIQMEVIPVPANSGPGNPPSFTPSTSNNFNNPEIPPGATFDFSREVMADEMVFQAENNIVVIVWPLTAPNDVDTTNNIFISELYIKSVEIETVDRKLESDPVIVTGSTLAGSSLLNIPPEEIVGFRYDSVWQQIPVQIDEMAYKDILDPYGPYRVFIDILASTPSGVNALFYTDENTYTGADPDSTFDANDELVFMYKDAGIRALTTDYPPGIIPESALEMYVDNGFPNSDKYVYLFRQDGTLQQDAGQSYVDYNFELDNGEIYPDDFNFLLGDEEEISSVTTSHYYWEFKNTWEIEKVQVGEAETEWFTDLELIVEGDISDNDFYDRKKCFIANKSGPVRAIRSYMGADDNPYFQRTHFFYDKKQDIATGINIDQEAEEYVDILKSDDIDNTVLYRNNIDVAAVPLTDFEEDNELISPTLYEDTPLEWELFTNPGEGAIISTHRLITNYTGLSGRGYLPTSNDEKTGIKVLLDELCTTPFDCPQNYIQHWRHLLFDTLDAGVVDASNYAKWVQTPISTSWENYLVCQPLQVNVLLEAAVEKATGKLNTSLFSRNLLPGQPFNQETVADAYSVFPWYIEPDLSLQYPSYDTTSVDWIIVGFRSDIDPTSTIARTPALLNEDGDIEFADKCLLYDVEADSVYITIEHRNHLGIISPTGIPLSTGNALQYNFSTQDAYNANNTRSGQIEVVPGKWAMIAGNGTKTLSTDDINGDDKASWSVDSGLFEIYSDSDYDLNGEVTGADKILWLNNNGKYGSLPK